MNRATLGGAVDYRALAELNKPKDAAGIRAAALEMARNGLTDLDIGRLLGLDTNAVRRLIGECAACDG